MKNDFGRLKRKIFTWVILTAIGAFLCFKLLMFFFIDGIFQNSFANGFIFFCEKFLRISYDGALMLYSSIFRNYKSVWMQAILFVVMIIIFYYGLTRFTNYFNEISRGVDKLVEESGDEIVLSPEMDFMEKKLNAVKRTLEKRASDAQQAEQRKNDLVLYLAHDIKTPLTSVIGYLSLLDEACDMPEQQRKKYVKITLDKSYRLEQLINEFFEITRFNLQTIVLEKDEINLNFMLQQMADEFYPLLEPEGKKAVVEGEEPIGLLGDVDKLARVFNNILKNAMAYSYPNTTIKICAMKRNENVVITFTNSGKAIPAQKLNSIFEKFYRVDTSRSSSTGGSGLGLAIAKEIVNAHGGSIYAESDEEKTVFTVMLPSEK